MVTGKQARPTLIIVDDPHRPMPYTAELTAMLAGMKPAIDFDFDVVRPPMHRGDLTTLTTARDPWAEATPEDILADMKTMLDKPYDHGLRQIIGFDRAAPEPLPEFFKPKAQVEPIRNRAARRKANSKRAKW